MISPRINLELARIKLLLWRLLATRAALRLVRRAADWMVPAG